MRFRGCLMGAPRAPRGLDFGGSRLWKQISGDFELGQHEEAVLLQACRIVDVLDRLQVVIASEGVVVASPQGSKANPAVVEFRQQSVALAKLMASLRIPLDDASGRTPQQRVGVRRAGAPR
jgi:hypothetical protein